MGFSTDDAMVRVDFFKPSGKWYTHEAIKWIDYHAPNIHDTFLKSIKLTVGDRYSSMTAVCLHPHHIFSHPIMLVLE